MNIEQIAGLAHEMNRVYCEAIGDFSQPSWKNAPEWQRKSAIGGVKFRIENKEVTSCDMHNEWLREKLANGWVYGPVKDVNKKTHPCCVPYENLSLEQRIKDTLFNFIVDTTLPLLNKEGDSNVRIS